MTKVLKNLKKKINLYFQNKTDKIEVKIRIQGNLVQKKVWKQLRKIKKIIEASNMKILHITPQAQCISMFTFSNILHRCCEGASKIHPYQRLNHENIDSLGNPHQSCFTRCSSLN